eukprot:972039-Rhodomonas_salina.1
MECVSGLAAATVTRARRQSLRELVQKFLHAAFYPRRCRTAFLPDHQAASASSHQTVPPSPQGHIVLVFARATEMLLPSPVARRDSTIHEEDPKCPERR